MMIVNFVFSNFLNTFILIANTNRIIYLNKENFLVEKEEEIKDDNYNFANFLEINFDNKIILFSKNHKLYFYNLINKNFKIIEFTKVITVGLYLDDSQVVIGDVSGKIHFITNFNEQKVFIIINIVYTIYKTLAFS
jgi:hypothetical protein